MEQNLDRAEAIIDAYGCGAAAATKSDLILRDTDLYQSIQTHSPVVCKVTVTTVAEDLAAKVEPRAPSPARRLKAVEGLARAGIFCGVLLMPVLPFLEDRPEQVLEVVDRAADAGARFVYPGFGVTMRQGQREHFLRQLDLAREIKKPVIIHSRDAAKDTVDLMTEAHAEEIGGVIHCYSYTKETAKIFLDMGFYFGIGGVLTFKNAKKLKEAVEYIPMDRIVLETDCPYLAPEPNRGKRNSSLNIPYVIAAMAQIKGITEEEVRKAAWDNSLRLYHMEK